MHQIFEFFEKLLDCSDWPSRLHSGYWTDFTGWLYIISDLLIGFAYFVIPIVIFKYPARKKDTGFVKLYLLFAGFMLASGAIYFLDAVTFWLPVYRLSALLRFLTGVISWVSIFFLIRNLSFIFSTGTQHQLKTDPGNIEKSEPEPTLLNIELSNKIKAQAIELSAYKYALGTSSIVAITNPKGIINYVNDTFCHLSQYSREELIGQDHHIINSGYQTAAFIRSLWKTIASGRVWKGELNNKAKDGSIYWTDTTIVPFLDAYGKPYQYIVIESDITEKKKIKEQVDLYEMTIRFSEDAIINLSKNNIIISWNSSAENKFGYSGAEIIDRPVSINTPAKKMAEEVPFKKIMLEGEPVKHFETERLHKNGKIIYIALSLSLRKHTDGSIIGITKTAKDITEKKETTEALSRTEHIYRTITSNIPGTIICLFDYEHRFILIEGDMLETIGFSKVKLLHKKITQALPADIHTRLTIILTKVFAGKTVIEEGSIAGYDFISKYVPLRDKTGEIFNVMLVFSDISALKIAKRAIEGINTNLEKMVDKRTEQFDIANKEFESLSYSISHDLRAPLRAINGYSRILSEDFGSDLNDEGKKIIVEILNNSKKMGLLIDEILNFSKLERKEVQSFPFDMTALVRTCVDQSSKDNFTGIRTINIGDLPAAKGDPAMIKQVWINLISNAIKYSSKKEHPVIEITGKEDGMMNIYAISDNGAGFNMQYADKLFGVFQRLHNSEEFEGIGAGLALVQRLIHKNNGKVWGEGKEGSGATFYFSLPNSR